MVNIVSTIGPAILSPESLSALLDAGTRVFRQNFSHGELEEKADIVKIVRKLAEEKGIANEVKILQDLPGPKIRLGNVDGIYETKVGEELILDYSLKDAPSNNGNVIPVQYNLVGKIKVGDPVYINDGKVETEVAEIMSEVAIKLVVKRAGVISTKKGLNLPTAVFTNEDIFTKKDLEIMKWGADKGYDWVAISFIQNADNMKEARKHLANFGYAETTKLVAKIETRQATASNQIIEDICKESDVIMVARGDMGYEVGYWEVPVAQRKIIAAARKHNKETIVATQTMSSMEKSPICTRSEADNVEAAYVLGADYVMTSEETAVGLYPTETTATIRTLLDFAQENMEVISLEELMRVAKFE